MRTLLLVSCLLSSAAPALSAQAVPVDILTLYDGIPDPPTTILEAWERSGCTFEGGCDVERYYGAIGRDLRDIERRIELAVAAASPASAAGLAGMSPEEIQKKLASMTQQEQIEFAMEMSRRQSAAMPVHRPEPPAVRAAAEEATRLTVAFGDAVIAGDPTFQSINAQLIEEADDKHSDAGAYATSPRFKDAQGLPGPGWDQAQLDAMEMSVAAEQEYEQALALAFRDEVARLKAEFAKFQELLAAAAYGKDAVNDMTRRQLLTVQQQMLEGAKTLLRASIDATQRGANTRMDQLEVLRNHEG